MRSGRRAVLLTVAVWVGAAAAVALAVLWMAPGGWWIDGRRGAVALVDIDGLIVDVEPVLAELRAHREDRRVRAVVVRINSPGGVVAPTQAVHAAVLGLRRTGKPVVASLGAVAASGGYYIATAADHIVAQPGSLTGSIGVVLQLANLEGLLRKVGVEYVVVKSGRFKDVGQVGRPMTPAERRMLQEMLDDVHAQFVSAVVAGRRLPEARVLALADGRVLSGSRARELGLVDVLGGSEDAVALAGQLAGLRHAPAVMGPRPRPWSLWSLVRGQLGWAPGSSWGAAAELLRTPLYVMD